MNAPLEIIRQYIPKTIIDDIVAEKLICEIPVDKLSKDLEDAMLKESIGDKLSSKEQLLVNNSYYIREALQIYEIHTSLYPPISPNVANNSSDYLLHTSAGIIPN